MRIARVIVDIDVPHLDRPFDYLIPESLSPVAAVGSLVSVKWGQQRQTGWIVDITSDSDHPGVLAPLLRVLSKEPLFTEKMLETYRYISLRYASTLSQVLSIAIPLRRAKMEDAPLLSGSLPILYPEHSVDQISQAYGNCVSQFNFSMNKNLPRVVAGAVPGLIADHLRTFLHLASQSGIPVAIMAPTYAQAKALYKRIVDETLSDRIGFTASELPATQRYLVHLRAARGELAVVVGTRSAIWTPFSIPGVLVIWDDGSDHYRERRNPKVDVLDVAVARCQHEGYGLLSIAYSRSLKAQALVQSGWGRAVDPIPTVVRNQAPRIRVIGEDAFEREGVAARSILPGAAFDAIRGALKTGAALVQVASAGRWLVPFCPRCEHSAICQGCKVAVSWVSKGPGGWNCRNCRVMCAEFSCAECGFTPLQPIQLGAERIGRDLGLAFPGVSIVVSASSTKIQRTAKNSSKIVVATSGAEPRIEGGYQTVIISEAEVVAYGDQIGATEEAMRRWFNAFALAAPQSPALLCGQVPVTMARTLMLWQPASYAVQLLAERREIGFFPSRWVVTLDGLPSEVAQVVTQLESDQITLEPAEPALEIRGSVQSRHTETQRLIETPSLFDLEPVDGRQPQPGLSEIRTIIACQPRQSMSLMRHLRSLTVSRGLQRRPPVRITVNPPELFES